MAQRSSTRPRRRSARRREIKWGRLLASLIIVWALVALGGAEWQMVRAHRNIADLERQIEIEGARAESLAAEIAYRNSAAYIELVARRELGLVKPGEISVMLGVSP